LLSADSPFLFTLGTLAVAGSAFARVKPLTFVAHLSLEGPQSRRRLATLFWPEAADPLNQLSLTLSRLKKHLPGALEADANSVEARVACDARLLRDCLAAGDVERASSLYGGEFFRGFSAKGVSSELREWLDDTRDDLARSLQRSLLRQAARVARSGSQAGAVALVRRAVHVHDASLLDAEELLFAHDALVWARDPAARRFRVEVEDLGLDLPSVGGSTVAATERAPEAASPPYGAAKSRVIGRRRELGLLHRLLVEQRQRLVTVTGPGGVGKSLLAMTAAEAAVRSGVFPGGLAYVACDTLDCGAEVARATMAALDATSPVVPVTRQQLASGLGRRANTLVFLDDFDRHAGQADWLLELLRNTPGMSLLVTATRPVDSADEHVLPLAGLTTTGPLAGAVGELFVARALRADAGFELSSSDQEHLVELGRLSGGNPLAIELAAAWMGALGVPEIVSAVRGGLGMLSTAALDVPARHRSLMAVFQRCWTLLDDDDRERLSRLSVLRGSFDRITAAAVANVDLPQLARLCRGSLLVRPQPGRFECVPLFRDWIAALHGEVRAPVETARLALPSADASDQRVPLSAADHYEPSFRSE